VASCKPEQNAYKVTDMDKKNAYKPEPEQNAYKPEQNAYKECI
jgi:hypothetical protein